MEIKLFPFIQAVGANLIGHLMVQMEHGNNETTIIGEENYEV